MNKNIQAIYPLTPLQEGILFHTIEMPNSDIYFQQFSCVIEGLSDPEKWRQSWQQVAQSHPIMRTLFTWKNQAQPLQIVRNQVSLPWTELDWSNEDLRQQEEKWASLNQRDRDKNFDLSTAPLMRFTLVKLSASRYCFLFSFHHIVLDGWSQRLLFDQALANYNDPAQSQQVDIHTYQSFVDWLGKQDKHAAMAFWSHELAGFERPTNIVNDKPLVRNEPDSGKRSMQALTINASTVSKLKIQARQHHLTLNSLILGAWSLILASHNRANDVLFGTTVAGRPVDLPHADKIAGLFINTLPCRVQIDPQSSLADCLAKIQSNQAACRQFEQTPLSDIQRYSELSAGTPLFESIIVVENLPSPLTNENQNNLAIKDPRYTEFSHYPLAILVEPSDGLQVIAVHQESKVSAQRATDVLEQINTVLMQMSESLNTPIAKVATLSEAHIKERLALWNQTQHDFAQTLPVHQVFEKYAASTPNKIAIIDMTDGKAQELSYAEVNNRANQLARFMSAQVQSASALENCIVPILLERSAQSLISFLAVMKAGAAYIPLDAEQPAQRNTAIISSLQSDELLVISQSSLQGTLPPSVSYLVLLDTNKSEIENCSVENLQLSIDLRQLAYIIYTSGSTGVPKGVMIEHKALANSTLARHEFYSSAPNTFLLMSSLATDSSIAGIYWTLCSGNTLVLPAKRAEQDLHNLGQIIRTNEVSHMLCIPSLYQLILEHCNAQDLQSLNTVIVAGESCNQGVIMQHQKRLSGCLLYNEYGPSESCVWATATCLSRDQADAEVTIGKPISNTQTYVTDQNLQLVLPQVVGELYIGGRNIARGYLHEAEKTAQVFINNPFADQSQSSPTLYKTGDLVRQTTNGDLVFVGRADNQFKLRGFRIEPEEIEHVLCSHPLIEEALVFADIPAVSDEALSDGLLAIDDAEANALLTEIERSTEEQKLGVSL